MQKPLNILNTSWRDQSTINIELVRNIPWFVEQEIEIHALEVWANEECTLRPSSLDINRGDTIYFQVNRDVGINQKVSFLGSEGETELGRSSIQCYIRRSSIQCYINDGAGQELYSFISIDDDHLLAEYNNVMKAGDIFPVTLGSSRPIRLRSFSLGPLISSHPSIIPQSACAVPMIYDSTENVWIYGLACLNTNGEYVFLESPNGANKIVVTSEKYEDSCYFAFSPSPLPDLEGYDGTIDFKFTGGYNHVYGKHKPYEFQLSDKYETEPGYFGYYLNIFVDNQLLFESTRVVVGDESPMEISIHNEIE